MENKNENVVNLVGKLIDIRSVWSSDCKNVYEGTVQVVRDSGATDYLPILFINDNGMLIKSNTFVQINGQFRSRDISVGDGKLKVQLFILAKEIKTIDEPIYKNEIEMTGYICKNPTLRNTPSGKQVSDLLIACNYSKDKSAYIPVITWGREARKSGKYPIGTAVKVCGRIQSRKYIKVMDNGESKELIAYELSANSIEQQPMPTLIKSV